MPVDRNSRIDRLRPPRYKYGDACPSTYLRIAEPNFLYDGNCD